MRGQPFRMPPCILQQMALLLVDTREQGKTRGREALDRLSHRPVPYIGWVHGKISLSMRHRRYPFKSVRDTGKQFIVHKRALSG